MLLSTKNFSSRSKDKLHDLGKLACAAYTGTGTDLSSSVANVLKTEENLTREHMCRVVEFANNEAFKHDFSKLGGSHRVVSFQGGPADPNEVEKQLRAIDNSPSRKDEIMETILTNDLFEKNYIPGLDTLRRQVGQDEEVEKTASEKWYNEHGDLLDLYDKLCAARNILQTKIAQALYDYDQSAADLRKNAHDVLSNGHSPAEIARIYNDRSPSTEITKLALCVARNAATNIVKLASKKFPEDRFVVNQEHPLCTSFDKFASATQEVLATTAAIDKVAVQIKKIEPLVKRCCHE